MNYICNMNYNNQDVSVVDIYNTSMLGNIAIYVEEPMFTTPAFTPRITVGQDTYEVNWGETLLLNDLVLENYYTIQANTMTIDEMTFTPILSQSYVQALKTDFQTILVQYVQNDLTNSIYYTLDHSVISVNGNTVTMNLSITNMGETFINNWQLEYCFMNNEIITETMNTDYIQNDNYVQMTSSNIGSSIPPNTTETIIMKVETKGEEIELINILLNSQATINTTGTFTIYVDNPVFDKELFIPTITVNGENETDIMWGTAEIIDGLPLDEELCIYATPYSCNNITYYPVLTMESITLMDTAPQHIDIQYYSIESLVDLQYNIDYDLSEFTDGFVCTITISNLNSIDINGWSLDFEFLNDQMIEQFWSSNMMQDGNKVRVLPAQWNSIIRGNSSISFGFQGGNPAAINYPTNPILNGATPNPRYAILDINLPNPTYPVGEYTPTIELDGQQITLNYGDTKSIQVLAQSVHVVKASTDIGPMEAYLTSNALQDVFILPSQTNTVELVYYKALNNPNVFSGYFASWADYGENLATQTQLGSLAPYVTYVPIAFGKPFMDYTGSDYDLDNLTAVTGIEFGYSAQLLKDSIANLRARSPYVKILLSLGGETYNKWENLKPTSIAKFIQDFDLDGVDIDFEQDIGAANCAPDKDTKLVHCTTDKFIIEIITELRAVLPRNRNYVLTFSAWSVGAYGEGDFVDAPPANLTTTGVMLTPLREAGSDMDLMNIMAYNAVVTGQPPYVPEQAGDAYATYFPNGINCIGAHVPPDAQGTDYWTVDNVVKAARYAKNNNIGGMMLWYLQRQGNIPGSNNVDICNAIRENLGFPDYPGPLYYGVTEENQNTGEQSTTCGCNDDIFSKS